LFVKNILFTFLNILNNLPKYIFLIVWFLNITYWSFLHNFIKTGIAFFIIAQLYNFLFIQPTIKTYKLILELYKFIKPKNFGKCILGYCYKSILYFKRILENINIDLHDDIEEKKNLVDENVKEKKKKNKPKVRI